MLLICYLIFETIREIIPVSILDCLQLMNIVLVLGMMTLCETVPALVFSHFECQVHVLLREFENIFKLFDSRSNNKLSGRLEMNPGSLFATQLRQLFAFYETVRSFVSRANSLFGVLLFLNHGMRLIVICMMLYYSVFYLLPSSPVTVGIYLVNLVINLYELVVSTLLTAQLYCVSDRLRSLLTILLTRYWDLIPNGEQQFLVVFIGRLQTDPLAATPLGHYNVTPSFLLLTVASLALSFVIILLQSK